MKKFLHLTTVLLCAILSGAMAQAPSVLEVQQNGWTKIIQAPVETFKWMHYPRGISYDILSGGKIIKKALINWQTNADVVQFPMYHGWAASVNEGVNFNAPSATNRGGADNDLDMMVCFRRNTDGVMVSIPFYLGYTGANPNPPFIFNYFTSADNGTTWDIKTDSGTVTGFPAGQQVAGFRFHRGVIQDADGTLYAPAHAQWRKPDGSYESMRVMLMKSTNGGDTWNYLSTIRENAGEATIARGKNGSILAVMRVENTSMVYKISSAASNGTSWSASATVPDIPANKGVDPYLQWMPNGILALSYGDNVTGNMRNCHMAYSVDDGVNWVGHSVTYQSTAGSGFQNKSSGYTSAFPLRNNRFMQLSDRALYTYYDSGDPTPSPNPFSIWSSTFDVVTNYRNRIDLKKRVSPGQVEFLTDMTYTNATHPEAGVYGAYDASTDYWSGAFKQASSGYYTIDLKRNQTINAIAVSLLHGKAQGATIEHSQDGINWTLLKTYPGTTIHYTVDYTSFSTIVARYVRVNVTSSIGWVGLNEISLFSPEDTFEDYALNVKPYGYTMLNTGFWVSEGVTPLPTGHQSQRALYMYDADGANKELSRTGYTVSDAQIMEFKLMIKDFAPAGCVQFCLKSGATPVFRIAVFPVAGTSNGTIKYYNGSWNNLLSGTGTLIPKNAWRSVKVVADAPGNVAAIYIDGTFSGYATKQTAGATSMNGIMFASGGSGAIGDEALFDDVILYPYGTIPGLAKTSDSPIPVKSSLTDKNLDQINSFGIRLSPNPAGSTMGLTVSNADQGKLFVQVVNISGTIVKKVEFTVTESTAKYEMPISDLAQGMYIVQVTQGKNTVRAKLIKQ